MKTLLNLLTKQLLTVLSGCAILTSSAIAGQETVAETLDWKLGVQAYTFRALTFFETVDKAHELGLKYIEMYPGQKLKPGSEVKTGPNLTAAELAEVQAKLKASEVKLISFGVAGIPTNEPAARQRFEWAKKLGIEVLVTETTPNDTLDKLSAEYGIKIALHNHPKTWPPEKILAATEGKNPLIGSCADVGHWQRAGLEPVATLNQVGARVIHIHFKDLAPQKGEAKTADGIFRLEDVPWGTGQSDVHGMMAQLKRQRYQGYFIIEYETGTVDELMQNLPKCIQFFNQNVGDLVATENPFLGNWALTLPGNIPGWLGVTSKGDQLEGSMLWGWASPFPVEQVTVKDQTLAFSRVRNVPRKDEAGKVIRTDKLTDTFTATTEGDTLKFTLLRPHDNDAGTDKQEFTGKRIPPVPAAPDLTKVKFGEAISLFNGKDLTGWRVMNPKAPNGWSVADGVLVNTAEQEEGKPHKSFTNLRTDREFTDFNLKLEVRVPKKSNSGVYLRGVYEIQVFDSFGLPVDSHNMGALYGRITPSSAAEKPAGEWQSLDITLVARHLTVILNGTKIIDNQPVLGITGGALTADEFKSGPIYLQGDDSSADFRNLVLRPVVE